jgi:hypothetical protein
MLALLGPKLEKQWALQIVEAIDWRLPRPRSSDIGRGRPGTSNPTPTQVAPLTTLLLVDPENNLVLYMCTALN